MTDESQELAPSMEAQLTEYKAQNARLESVILGLKQQVKALERDQNESLEHIRTVCRQRDEARQLRTQAEVRAQECQAAAESYEQQASSLGGRLADLERWREQAGPVVEAVKREGVGILLCAICQAHVRDTGHHPECPFALADKVPEPPKVTP